MADGQALQGTQVNVLDESKDEGTLLRGNAHVRASDRAECFYYEVSDLLLRYTCEV